MRIAGLAGNDARSGARRILALYASVAALWVIGSALLLTWLGELRDPASFLAALALGMGFVAVTGPALFVSVLHALRKHEEHEESLAEAARQIGLLARFPDLAPTPVLQLGANGSARYLNAAAGKAAEGAPRLDELLPAGYRELIDRCLASGEPVLGVMHELGDRTWSWTFMPDIEYGVVYAYATERTEELRLADRVAHTARMEAVGQLAAGVAHDFNNALQAIAGHASLLRMDAGSDETRADIDEILAAVDRAGLMVRRMLAFGHQGEATPEPLDLAGEVRNLSGLWRHLLPKSVDLKVRTPRSKILVRIEASELDQVMTNLVANAGDAMPEGGRLEITVEEMPAAAGLAEIRVADTGAGMSAEVLANAFEPFYTTKGPDGTGLGLPQVRAIVDQRGGALLLDSSPGQGTTFRIRLPLSSAVESRAREPEGMARRKT